MTAHETMLLIIRFVAAACLSAGILWFLLRTGLAWRLALDQPNQRSLHQRPIPRMGAWGMIPAALVCGLGESTSLALAVVVLATISYLDDRLDVPFFLRLILHFIVAVFFLYSIDLLGWNLWTGGVLLGLVWGTNLFNFMDGSDGLAGGMALIGFSAYALAFWIAGQTVLMGVSAALAGAALGFLLFNFHPARIFMGDAGSIPNGFLAGALGTMGWQEGVWPFWFPFLVFAPFLADATLTLATRILRGERFWQAHREHYYQRLIRSGWGHAAVARFAYILMFITAGLAFFAKNASMSMQLVTIFIAIIILSGVCWGVNRRWRACCVRHLGESE